MCCCAREAHVTFLARTILTGYPRTPRPFAWHPDRYDGRPPYPRDSYQDPYMTGSSSYDRRPTQNAPYVDLV